MYARIGLAGEIFDYGGGSIAIVKGMIWFLVHFSSVERKGLKEARQELQVKCVCCGALRCYDAVDSAVQQSKRWSDHEHDNKTKKNARIQIHNQCR